MVALLLAGYLGGCAAHAPEASDATPPDAATVDAANVQMRVASTGVYLGQIVRDILRGSYQVTRSCKVAGASALLVVTPLVDLPERWQRQAAFALARLGDEEARRSILERLARVKPMNAEFAMDVIDYLAAPWLLPVLERFLDMKIESPGYIECPWLVACRFRRGCDFAVSEIIRITGHRFSFSLDGHTWFTDEQLAEVRVFVRSLPEVAAALKPK